MTLENYSLQFLIGVPSLLIFFFIRYYKSLKVKTWDTTEGEIISINVINERYGSEYEDSGFTKKIIYQYYINEKRYESDQLNKGGQTHYPFYHYAAKSNLEYRIGMKVKVFYNPENLSDSVLDNTVPLDIFLFFVVVIVILVFEFF